MSNYCIWIVIGILVALLGILFAAIFRQQMGDVGFIFVAVGGFLVALGLYQKGRSGYFDAPGSRLYVSD